MKPRILGICKVVLILSLIISGNYALIPANGFAQDSTDIKAVTMHFEWPAGTEALVKTEKVREKKQGVHKQRIEASASFKMRVSRLKNSNLAIAFKPHGSSPDIRVNGKAAANEWNAVVGFWIGQEFEVGALYEAQAPAPLPLPGTPTVMMNSEISVVGKPFKCQTDKDSPLCVRLKTVTRPDQAEVKSVLESFLKKATEAAGREMRIIYKELDIITKIDMVTEIDTLKPHEYKMEKEVVATMIGPDGKESKGSLLDKRHSVYTYLTKAARE